MTLNELVDMKPRPTKLSIRQAAEIMGVTPRFLQMALQQGRLPFGIGVEMSAWSYYVNTERFVRWMLGQEVTYSNHRPTVVG